MASCSPCPSSSCTSSAPAGSAEASHSPAESKADRATAGGRRRPARGEGNGNDHPRRRLEGIQGQAGGGRTDSSGSPGDRTASCHSQRTGLNTSGKASGSKTIILACAIAYITKISSQGPRLWLRGFSNFLALVLQRQAVIFDPAFVVTAASGGLVGAAPV